MLATSTTVGLNVTLRESNGQSIAAHDDDADDPEGHRRERPGKLDRELRWDARGMTLLLVFRATNGLLLLADGRRTRTPASSLDSVPMGDTAKKSAITPAGNVVAMAAGSTQITQDRYVADLFEEAMRAQPQREAPTVESVARACFDALQPWRATFLQEERAVWVVVTGHDPGATESITYRFTLPTSEHPDLTDEVRREGMLAIPQLTNDGVAHLVRENFGHMPPDEFDELLCTNPDDPRLHVTPDEAYILQNQPLDVVAAEVSRVLPALLRKQETTFDDAGVGGTWTMYKLRPGQPADADKFPWGPHSVTN